MNIERLVQIGDTLARPCVYLNATSSGKSSIGAFWGGTREDIPDDVPQPSAYCARRHLVSVDSSLFSQIGIAVRFPFCVYEEENHDGETHPAIYRPDREFADIRCDGIPLYCELGSSFPPFPAVCLYGGDEVRSWLASFGRQPWEYSLIEEEFRTDYDAEFMKRSPLYAGNADAMLGGWHVLWSDDSFYMPQEMRLLIWTFRESEPWYEVWMDQIGNLTAKERIT